MSQHQVFVGRTEELKKLHRLFIKAINERTLQVVFVGGEAGTGKTTLVDRFIYEVEQGSITFRVARGKCTTENEMEGLAPFIQILDNLYEFGKRDKKWWKILPNNPWFKFFKEVAPAWLDIVTGGILSATKATIAEGKELLQTTHIGSTSLFDQYAKLIQAIGEDNPLIIFIDDMQWSDRSSMDMLFHLARKLQDVSILMVIAYRPTELTENKNSFQTIRNNIIRYGGNEIPNLAVGIEVKAYANQRFANNNFPPNFLETIQKRTDGYPLFVQQIFDWLQEKRLIICRNINDHQEWFLEQQELASIEIPESVQAVISNRLQQLDQQFMDILTFASVEGEHFTAQVIGELLNLEEYEILEYLEILERRYRLVKYNREIDFGNKTITIYQFEHIFYRYYIYDNLSKSRTRALHSKVAHAIQSLYAGHIELVGTQLARQFEQAKHKEQAANYYLLASKEAYKRFAWQESIVLVKTAYKLYRQLDEANENILAQVEAVLTWEACCERLGKFDEISVVIENAIQVVSTKTNEQQLQAKLLIALGWTQYYRSYPAAEITAKKALNIARQLNDLDLIYNAQALLSDVLVDELGKYEQGREILINQLQIARELKDIVKEADALAFLSWCLARIGYFEESIAASRQSLDLIITHEIDDQTLLAFANRCLGFGLQAQGNWEVGIEAINKALEIYEKLNDQGRKSWCQEEIADALFRQGNYAEAETLYQSSADYAEIVEDYQQIAWNCYSLAHISIENGRIEEAEERLQKAKQALLNFSGEWKNVWFNNIQIKVLLAKKDFERAKQIMVSNIPVVKNIESFIAQTTLYNTFGDIFRAEGNPEQALTWYLKSLHISQQIRDTLTIADSYYLMGHAYNDLGSMVEAYQHFYLAYQIYKAHKINIRIQQIETISPQIRSSKDFTIIYPSENIGLRYVNPVKLHKTYTCRYGSPSISYIDAAIFIKKYYVNCMACSFCHDHCCSYGVDIDIENLSRIEKHEQALEQFIGISSSLWFLPETRDERDYPGNRYVRTRVIDGACVFLNREKRGCYLHQYCLNSGIDYHELKPMISCLFPLTFDKGLLHPATEIYDESLICFASGPTLYQGVRGELLYYFGEHFVDELDMIERTFLRASDDNES